MGLKGYIQMDGKYYAGEDPDTTYKNTASLTSGFQPNTNRVVNKLKWSPKKSEAYEAWGARDVNSVLQKIETRLRLGVEMGETITVVLQNNTRSDNE